MVTYGKNVIVIETLLGNAREIETLDRGGTVLMNWKKIQTHVTFHREKMVWMFMEYNDTCCHWIQKTGI